VLVYHRNAMRLLAPTSPLASIPALLTLSALVVGGGLGCAGNHDKLVHDVDKLSGEISMLRARNLSLQDRVDALEEQGAKVEASTPVAKRPPLRVVRLTPASVEPSILGAVPGQATEVGKIGQQTPAVADGKRPVLHNHGGEPRVEAGAVVTKRADATRRGKGLRRRK
jgi:hypothetical protein